MIYTEHEERAKALGEYIVTNRATVRQAAKQFSVSKSTVHTDVAHRLRNIDGELWLKVKEILDENKQLRHIRGGLATREKYRIKNEV
jgi:putative DeoR family transcriptional regulator (stage III sporulation protein D)